MALLSIHVFASKVCRASVVQLQSQIQSSQPTTSENQSINALKRSTLCINGVFAIEGHNPNSRPLREGRQIGLLPSLGLSHPGVHQPRRIHCPHHLPSWSSGHLLRSRSIDFAAHQRDYQDHCSTISPSYLRIARCLRLPWLAFQPCPVHLLLCHLLLSH